MAMIKGEGKEAPTTVVIDEKSLGWKIFTAFVTDDRAYRLSKKLLLEYALTELKFPKESLTKDLEEYLPTILVVYMNSWSGWLHKPDYEAGKFTKHVYYEQFQKFMLTEMNCIVNGSFTSAMKRVEQELVSPPSPSSREFSPYAINIHCPAHMLNTLVFSNIGDDVIMKQHSGKDLTTISTTQLLNWPFIEVSFRTEDICFLRRQATEFVRYLNFFSTKTSKVDENNVIESAELLALPGTERQCFSNELLETYLKTYLKTLRDLPQVSAFKYEEIQAIITQFIEDVKYINVNNSMATDTAVLFRLCPTPFIRNKKLVGNGENLRDEERVGFCEVITPKVELTLMHFNAKQKNTLFPSFEYTDKLKETKDDDLGDSVLPRITYKCTYCNVQCNQIDSKRKILEHLRKEHKLEMVMRCTICEKKYEVLNLARSRWKHTCQMSAGTLSSDDILLVDNSDC